MTDQKPESTQEVERIRDIIFGAQMRDYDGRFEDVQREIDRLRKHFEQEIDRLSQEISERMDTRNAEQTKKLQNLRQQMRRADDNLQKELQETAQKLVGEKVDRLALAEMFSMLAALLQTGNTPSVLLEDAEELEQVPPDDGE